jgi:hypothetical protein
MDGTGLTTKQHGLMSQQRSHRTGKSKIMEDNGLGVKRGEILSPPPKKTVDLKMEKLFHTLTELSTHLIPSLIFPLLVYLTNKLLVLRKF